MEKTRYNRLEGKQGIGSNKPFFFFLCVLLLSSCGGSRNIKDDTQQAAYRKITADEARDMMAGADSFILLDVRTEKEFREKRIGGAVLIPDNEVFERAETELPDKNELILIYCRTGRRSAAAAIVLVEMGYNNVYDFGGIESWPYETVSD